MTDGRDVVICGGGIAGLASALALSQSGFTCTVLERDAETPPEESDLESGTWLRKPVPQFRHSHIFLARLRNILLDRFPTLLRDLTQHGVHELDPLRFASPEVRERGSMPGDESLFSLSSRRSVFEWVLRRRVMDDSSITFHRSVRVIGLDIEGEGPGRLVRSIQTDQGDVVTAGLVLDATGRNSHLWQAATDVAAPSGRERAVDVPSGMVYLTRFFKTSKEIDLSPGWEDVGWARCSIFPADREFLSVTLILEEKSPYVSSLRKADVFDRTIFDIPMVAARLGGATVTPLVSDRVEFMGGLRTRSGPLRTDSAPTNLLRVGDAAYTTNPMYGQGVTLAFMQADLLPPSQDLNLAQAGPEHDKAVAEAIEPYFRLSLQPFTASQAEPGSGLAERMRRRLAAAVREVIRRDPVVFRTYMRSTHMIDPPYKGFLKPAVMVRTAKGLLLRGSKHQANPQEVRGIPDLGAEHEGGI